MILKDRMSMTVLCYVHLILLQHYPALLYSYTLSCFFIPRCIHVWFLFLLVFSPLLKKRNTVSRLNLLLKHCFVKLHALAKCKLYAGSFCLEFCFILWSVYMIMDEKDLYSSIWPVIIVDFPNFISYRFLQAFISLSFLYTLIFNQCNISK